MNCQQIAELLPDYLHGALDASRIALVREHIDSCAACADEVAVWQKLALLPVEQPSVASRAHFEAMLDAYQTARGERPAVTPFIAGRSPIGNLLRWLRSPLGAFAWSAALLVLGLALGAYFGSSQKSHPHDDLTAMRSELVNLRQVLVLSMLQQQSAAERLQGVSYSQRDEQLDPQVQSALLRTLRYDNSVDVRLAALDALSRHASQPQVRKGLAAALQEQQSPLVQVALIDQLLTWRDVDAAQQLRALQQNPNLNPTVRKRAEWAVNKLTY